MSATSPRLGAGETGGAVALPASFAQQRLWFLDQLDGDASPYTLAASVRLHGELDVGALQNALDEIVSRHETLRTCFTASEEQVRQVVSDDGRADFRLVDLGDGSGASGEGRVAQPIRDELRHRFDLSHGPLFRSRLFRLGSTDHVLLVTMHHIVSDVWSTGVLVRELSALYPAFREGRPSPLPPLPIQYADYAHWQRERLVGEVLEEQLTYWRRHLEGATTLELQTDRPRPSETTYDGAREVRVVPSELSRGVRDLARREGVTPFVVLLAAFQALLSRYTGQDDVSVGTPIAGRTQAETEGLIGFFVNSLVMRTDLSRDPSVRELLRRVKERAIQAFEHQDLPFETLVTELQPQRDLGRHPLFQVMFALQNAPVEPLELPGLTLAPFPLEVSRTHFDIELHVVDGRSDLTAVLSYNTDLFEAETARRLLGHYVRLLEGMVARPEASVSSLPLLPDSEAKELLEEWNETEAARPEQKTVVDLFAEQAARTPGAEAVRDGEGTLSYGELDRRSNRLARHLRDLGVGPEVPVGVCLERSRDLVVGLLGILKAGGAYVPLDPGYPTRRLETMLEDASVTVLVSRQGLVDVLPSDAVVVCLDRDAEVLAARPDAPLPAEVGPRNLAYVIFTSGSTGRPKGVQVCHRGLVNLVTWHVRAYGVAPGDRATLLASVAFDASVWEIWPYLAAGASLHVPDDETRLQPQRLARWLTERAITHSFVMTPLAESLLAEPGSRKLCLRFLLTGGDKLHRGAVQDLPCPVINHYGPTESTVVTTSAAVEAGGTSDPPIGRPISNTRVYVLDGQLRLVPRGAVGELFIAGEGLARGYLGRPGLTAESFVPDPFSAEPGGRLYRTGDLVRYRPDGSLEFLDRVGQQVKVRGYRIELGEIESVLSRHPAVAEAAVLAREDDPGDKRLVAYVARRQGSALTPADLREALAETLPAYMVPQVFVFLESLPLSPNGKVDRRGLPAPGRADGGRVALGPRTPVEEGLREIWAGLLGLDVESVGVDEDFFSLGGHSLLATQVVSAVRRTFEVEVSLRALFAAPTIAGLARLVEAERLGDRPAPPRLRPYPRDRMLPLSFAQQRLWFLDQLGAGAAYNVPVALRLRGRLDEPALAASLHALLERHEVLRTSFPAVGGEPSQSVKAAGAPALERVELVGRTAEEREEEALRLAAEEAGRPFDLEKGPLVRARLLRLFPDDHVLLLTVHHIAADGWSMGVITQELATQYRARLEGLPDSLPELDVQYADYARWQREWLSGAELERQLGYWRRQLDGVSALELQTDRPRPATATFNGAREYLALPPELARGLKEMGRRQGATLFMVLLAGFQALLSRYTGQDDVAVGTPIANRNREETEELVGFFANSLVMRGDLSGDPRVEDLVGRVKDVALQAYDHQDLPFETLVSELQPERDKSRNPLFQVMLTLQDSTTPPLELPGLDLAPLRLEKPRTRLELELHVADGSTTLTTGLSYNTDLFDRETARRLLRHYRRLLEGMVSRPEARISSLPLMSPSEEHLLLKGGSGSPRSYPAETGIAALFEDQARRRPHAPAVAYGDVGMTYGELERTTAQLALRLQGLGVEPGARVGVHMARSAEMVVAFLAILKAGGAYVPLDPSYPRERLAFMLEDAGVTLVLTDAELRGRLPEGGAPAVCLPLEEGLQPEEPDVPRSVRSGDSLAYVIYTSGSTGTPKGVAVTDRAVIRLVRNTDYVQLGPTDRIAQASNASFDAATFELWGALLTGATLVGLERETVLAPADLAEAILREGITTLFLTTALFNQVAERAPTAFQPLRTLLFGGEAVEPRWVRQVLEQGSPRRLLHVYGPTENTTFSTWHHVTDVTADARTIPVGRAIENSQAVVFDRHLNPVPVGVVGELFVGGDGLARGYLNRPSLTAERFVPHPAPASPGERLYRTGDLVRYRADGAIEFLGRNDHQVKIRGFRVELGEIESVLSRHAGVSEATLVVREDEPGDRRLVAYVVLDPGSSLTPGDLRGAVGGALPGYMVPQAFVFLDALPLNPNGKVDRGALPRPETADVAGDVFVPPRDDTETRLAGIWAEALGLSRVGVHQNFYDLGGHSLLLVKVHARVREAFPARDVALVELFEHSTVASLAERLRSGASASAPVPDGSEKLEGRQRLGQLRERRRRAGREMGR